MCKKNSDGKKGVPTILKAFEIHTIKQRELLNLSADAGDEVIKKNSKQ